ncbi:MAG: DUF6252 family protein [Saprospiraceae bacterium]
MKSIQICLLAGLFSLCLFTSCKKDADDGGVVEIPEGIFAKIDGADFAPTFTQGIDMGDVVWLSGSKSNGSTSLSLRLPIDALPGTYTFPAADPSTLSVFYTYLAGDTYGAKSGKIVVTKHDVAAQTIEGTFEVVCQSISSNATVTLTEGTFKMGYQ